MGHRRRIYISATFLTEQAMSKFELSDQLRKSVWEKDTSDTPPPFNNTYHKAVHRQPLQCSCSLATSSRQYDRWESLSLNRENLQHKAAAGM